MGLRARTDVLVEESTEKPFSKRGREKVVPRLQGRDRARGVRQAVVVRLLIGINPVRITGGDVLVGRVYLTLDGILRVAQIAIGRAGSGRLEINDTKFELTLEQT